MKKDYDKFINDFQTKLDKYFEEYSEYIYCHENCSGCCETGEYPFSQLEMAYLMKGFLKLPQDIKDIIKNNIENLKKQKSDFNGERFEYTCPFLIEKKCSVYQNRGITCRVHGLAYLRKNNTVNLPHCGLSPFCLSFKHFRHFRICLYYRKRSFKLMAGIGNKLLLKLGIFHFRTDSLLGKQT